MWKLIIVLVLSYVVYSNFTAKWRQPSHDPNCHGMTNMECDVKKEVDGMSDEERKRKLEELREDKYNDAIRN